MSDEVKRVTAPRPYAVRVRELWTRHYLLHAENPQAALKRIYDALLEDRDELPSDVAATEAEFLAIDDPATWAVWDISMEERMVEAIDVIQQLMAALVGYGVNPQHQALVGAMLFSKKMAEYVSPEVRQAAEEGRDDVMAIWYDTVFRPHN